MTKRVSVIVLNWNRGIETIKLLKNLRKQTFKDFETIVVDNNSSDDSQVQIKAKFPDVKLVRLNKNYGKAGFNFAIKEAKGDFLIMFDSDAEPDSYVVEKYIKELKAGKITGLVCPAVYTSSSEYFGPAYDAKKLKGGGADVLFFCGTSVATKKDVFERVGGYEERFFLCLEELEWATRMRLAGYQVKVFPDIKVKNLKSDLGSNYRQSLGFYYARNWIWYYAKYLPMVFWPSFIIKHLSSAHFRAGRQMSMKYKDILKGLMAGFMGIGQFMRERVVISDKLVAEVKQNVFLRDRSGWKEGVSTEK